MQHFSIRDISYCLILAQDSSTGIFFYKELHLYCLPMEERMHD
ncbi:hypothetical protein ACOXY8_14980 [Cytophagales bacterium SYC-11]